jgi:Tfp pilus assembly protein PilZ
VTDPNPIDDLDSIFDEAVAAPETASRPGSAAGGEIEPPPGTRLGALVGEFLTLDHRGVHGDPPLEGFERERLVELHDLLAYEFGAASPPLAGSRRRALRVPTQLKVNTGGGEAVANLCSLSHGGAFIETADLLAPGTSMQLAIDSGNGDPPLQVAASVKWTREIANLDGPAGVGVEFEGIEDDDFIAIEKLVARALYARARDAG